MNKPAALLIVPPYAVNRGPPAGAAALLGYLKANGCHDIGFWDLRLWLPDQYGPTFRTVGAFGENYVVDVPDLPLVLRMLRAAASGEDLVPEPDPLFERYCAERLLDSRALTTYLRGVERMLRSAVSRLQGVRFVGMSVWSSNYLTCLMAAALLKRLPQPPVVVFGGPQCTESRSAAHLALASGLVDAVSIGEGENALLQLYGRCVAESGTGRSLSGIDGTRVLGDAGELVERQPRLLKLPELPPPSFDEMDLACYAPRRRTIVYQLSRGCTDKCAFCSEWVFWQHYRSDTAEHAVEQLVELKRRYDFQRVQFTDSLLNGHAKRLRSFAEAVLSAGLEFEWGGFMRAQVDDEMADLLYRAGLRWAFLGIESMDDETLNRMNKRRTESDNIRSLRALLARGVRTKAGIIPGFPGDRRENVFYTARALSGLYDKYPSLFHMNIEAFSLSPGQPISKHLDQHGLATAPWPDEYLDIDPRYRSITEGIPCTVDGSNQGLERLGQLRSILHHKRDSDRTWRGHNEPFPLTEELSSSRHILIPSPKQGWALLCRTIEDGLIGGWIMSPEEQRELTLLCNADNPSTVRPGVDHAYEQLLAQADAAHLVGPRREIEWQRVMGRRQADVTTFRLSPFAVVRFTGDGEALVAHTRTGVMHVVSAAVAEQLASLAARPSVQSPVTWAAALHELHGLGLMVADAEPAREPARELAGEPARGPLAVGVAPGLLQIGIARPSSGEPPASSIDPSND